MNARPKRHETAPVGGNSRLPLAMAMVAYAWTLHYAYATLISPVFFYLGLTYRPPSPLAVVLSFAAVLIPTLALPRRITSSPGFVLWTLHLVAVSPSILILQYADILDRGSAELAAVAISAIFVALILATRSARLPFAVRATVPLHLLQLAGVTFTILFTALLVTGIDASFSFVGLTEVQDVRSSYKSAVSALPLLGYALQFQTAALNPVFMAAGVALNRLIPLTAGIIGQILIYSVTGYKLTILSPIFVIALALFLRGKRSFSGFSLASAMVITMIASIALDTLLTNKFLVTVFVNRLIAAPGVLTAAYLHVFDGQPKYLWSHSFMAPFIEPPYDLTPGYLVGRVFQNVDSQANVNLFGDGYANWGWTGVIIEAAFLVLVLATLGSSAKGLPLAVTAPSTLVAALGLANNSAFSSVLTGGFGGLILIFAMWPRGEADTTASTGAGAEEASHDATPKPPVGAHTRRC